MSARALAWAAAGVALLLALGVLLALAMHRTSNEVDIVPRPAERVERPQAAIVAIDGGAEELRISRREEIVPSGVHERSEQRPRGGSVHVRGRVVSIEDGEGVAGAFVRCIVARDVVGTAQTDAAGEFVLGDTRPGRTTLEASLDDVARTSVDLGSLVDGASRSVLIRIARAPLLSGLVVLPGGEPATDVEVVAARRPREGERHVVRLAARSDAEGRFALTEARGIYFRRQWEGFADPADPSTAHLEVPRFDVVARTARRDERALVAQLDDVLAGEDVVLELGPGCGASGRVVDDRGLAVTVFEIEATTHDDAIVARDASALFDDPSGAFELGGLVAGRWTLVAKTSGGATSLPFVCDVPEESVGLTLRVARPARIAGRVVDSNGDGVRGADVGLARMGPFFDRYGTVPSSEDGRFVFPPMSLDTVRLTAEKDDFAPSEPLLVAVEPGQDVDDVVLVLRPAGAIEGIARRPAGAWATDQAVSLRRLAGDGLAKACYVDAVGSFRFDSLPAGGYELRLDPSDADHEALRDGSIASWDEWCALQPTATVTVVVGETTYVDLRAGRTGIRLVGTLRANGAPLAGVGVDLWRADGGSHGSGGSTGDDGRYEAELDCAGTYELSVWDADLCVARRVVRVPAVELHRFDVQLETGALGGSARDAVGEPVEGALVRVTPDDVRARGGVITETDAAGAWLVPRLEAGTYVVRVGGREAWDDDAQPACAAVARGGVVVRAGERTTVDLDVGGGGRVVGRVVDPHGVPIGEAVVFVRAPRGRLLDSVYAQASDDGRFAIEDLGAGAYELIASCGDSMTASARPIVVRANGTVEVELVIVRGTWLEVRGREAQGERVSIAVEVVDAHGGDWSIPGEPWLGIEWVDAERPPEQRFGPLPPGRYLVRAANAAGALVEREVVVGGAPELVVEVRFE